MNNELGQCNKNKVNGFVNNKDVLFKNFQKKGQGEVSSLKSLISLKEEQMGNPRKWLMAGEGISTDTRSQSLPDCHDIKINGSNVVTHLTSNDVNNTSPSQESWFNTWPEKIHKSSEHITESHTANDCDINNKNNKCGHLTLSEALDTFRLAYNPITKQLQLVESNQNEVNVDSGGDSTSDSTSAEKVKTGHHRTIGASSFSSTVSTLSDPSSSGSLLDNDDHNSNNLSTKPKKKGFSEFFSRKVFSSTGSWRLFGMGRSSSIESITSTSESLVASSSALIQHIRPATLPAKDFDEERRHRDEYEAILQAVKKRDIEYTKARKKKQEKQFKQEEQLSAAAKQWANNILPFWDTLYNQRKTRELWWQGLPPSVRGRVWIVAIGNELNITSSLYTICLARAREHLQTFDANLKPQPIITDTEKSNSNMSKEISYSNKYQNKIFDETNQESSMNVIQLDISRTFPNLGIFQEGGPYFNILHELLAAYVCYRPDVGYVQGMSFLAAILILNMEPVDAFICFANLVNRPLMLSAFTVNQTNLNSYFVVYNELLKENLPKLYNHFLNVSLSADLYLMDWIYTVFAKAMPLDLTCRVWDLFLRDGEEFIFRTALGILNLYQDILIKLDFLDGAQFLTRLPDDMSSDDLFHSIKSMIVSSNKRTFIQLLDKCKDSVTVSSSSNVKL